MPFLIGEAPTDTFTHRVEETGSGPHHVVSFVGLPEHIDVALRAIGESVRIPGSWATVDGQRMSSLVALWNRLDCYRQSLAVADRQAFCAGKAASLQSRLGCGAEACTAPCQFLCTQCTLMETHPTVSIVHPGTQVLAVLGEIEWCPNLARPPHL